MKKAAIVIAVLLAGFLIRSNLSMKPTSIEKYLQEFSLKSAQNPPEACEMVDDKIDVSIRQETPTGTWEVEGGKDELCGFMEQGRAAMVLLQGNMNWHYENVKVKSSFPWQSAKVSYDEISTVSAAKIGTVSTKMHYDLQVKRSLFGGIKVTKLKAMGGSQ